MRRYMQIVESKQTLAELQTTQGAAPPPVIPDHGDQGGPKGGAYWLKGAAMIRVPGGGRDDVGENDFAIQVYLHPEAFGLSLDDVIATYNRMYHNTEHMQRVLKLYQQEGEVGYLQSLGMRMAGMNTLFENGWGYLRYEPDFERITILAATAWAKRVVGAASQKFHFIQMEEVAITLFGKNKSSFRFRREDFPGFTGLFGAIMDWLRTGQIPTQVWYYAIVPSVATVTNGLKADFRYVSANHYNKKAYAITVYPHGMVDMRPTNFEGVMIRFPQEALPADSREGYEELRNVRVVYNTEPFSIPVNMLQVKQQQHWAPLA
jgi:hypothetical protein